MQGALKHAATLTQRMYSLKMLWIRKIVLSTFHRRLYRPVALSNHLPPCHHGARALADGRGFALTAAWRRVALSNCPAACHLYEDQPEVKREGDPIRLSERGWLRPCPSGVHPRRVEPAALSRTEHLAQVALELAGSARGSSSRPTPSDPLWLWPRPTLTRPSATPSSGGTARAASDWPPPRRSHSLVCLAPPSILTVPASAARTAAGAGPPRSPRS